MSCDDRLAPADPAISNGGVTTAVSKFSQLNRTLEGNSWTTYVHQSWLKHAGSPTTPSTTLVYDHLFQKMAEIGPCIFY